MSYVSNLQNKKNTKKNNVVNKITWWCLLFIVLFVIAIIAFAFISIIAESINTVNNQDKYSWSHILFGNEFNMKDSMAMGIIVVNTIWMSVLVLLVAAPISIATAVLITKILNEKLRIVMIAIVSILAAIPSVIYGAFGKYFILKAMGTLGLSPNNTTASLISVVIIVSLMVMPTITLMTITSIIMIDSKTEDSSEALGATKTQTAVFITLRSAKSGIIVGMLFALGRCIGEATAISMLDGETPVATGITLNPFATSLFMSPIIMKALSGSSMLDGNEFAYEVLSGILLMTVILLFLFVKFVEGKTDDNKKASKESKKSINLHNVVNKATKDGEESLNNKESAIYSNYLNKTINYKPLVIDHIPTDSEIYARSSLDRNEDFASYKQQKSGIYKAIIIVLSMVGVIALLSILLFLFNTDLSLLFNWEHLTSTGFYSEDDNYVGLGMAMFGTLANMFFTIIIALPLGIAIGIYANSFINRDSVLSKIISFSFQIMTSIPAVIYGTLATFLFIQTGFFKTQLNSFIPILMLVLVILPTIIKQTQEGFKNVKNQQIEGSYALGATTSYTSRRIVIKQSIPAILSSAILAISIVMADSAIMITILGKPDTPSDLSTWMAEGGYTLSSLIYWLSSMASSAEITSRQAAVEQMKVIGIILMLLIFWLTIISQKVRVKSYIQALVMLVGLVMYMCSFFIFGGSIILMILGPILGIIGFIFKFERKKV